MINIWLTQFLTKVGKEMSTINKDILIGLLFVAGVWSFISGQFIFSTVLFAGAAIFSNLVMRTSN